MLRYHIFTTRENGSVNNRVILSESYNEASYDLSQEIGMPDSDWWIISCYVCDTKPNEVNVYKF